ncbi:MAG TPA: sigma-70 family RNA polymerase sigma factor [Pirellulales bacterium]|nr:sigma-70 family RNA polymerase sigma factor [Pirellulales bacterium]
MGLSEFDRNLLDRCLARQPKAWEDFVDRFMGLVVHVANHTATARSVRLTTEDREDLSAEVFLAIIKDDFAVMRHFRGQSSLATYLTVIARRVVVKALLERKTAASLTPAAGSVAAGSVTAGGFMSGGANLASATAGNGETPEQRISDQEEVKRLLDGLGEAEAEVVRLYHLEGKSYQQISSAIGMPENSIGPTLSRAREKMRRTHNETSPP